MDILSDIMAEIEGVIKNVDRQELEQIVNSFDKNRSVFVDGEGRSGLMAKGFAMRLMHLGYTVYVIGETITPAIAREDILVSVSGSGTSASVLFNAEKAVEKGVYVVAVTSKKDSRLAKIAADVVIVPGTVKGEQGADRGSIQLLSSLFDQSLHITLDAICLLLSIKDQTSNEKATSIHW